MIKNKEKQKKKRKKRVIDDSESENEDKNNFQTSVDQTSIDKQNHSNNQPETSLNLPNNSNNEKNYSNNNQSEFRENNESQIKTIDNGSNLSTQNQLHVNIYQTESNFKSNEIIPLGNFFIPIYFQEIFIKNLIGTKYQFRFL
jgi:hypothetical protein